MAPMKNNTAKTSTAVPKTVGAHKVAVKTIPSSLPPDNELEPLDLHLKAPAVSFEKAGRKFDVLLFVVNDQEMQAALRFVNITARCNVSSEAGTTEPAYVGTMPCVQIKHKPLSVLLLQSGDTGDQGSAKAQAMLQNVFAANVKVRLCIAAGCCFGFSKQMQKMYDVAVSSAILGYENVRLQPGGDIDRNKIQPIDVKLKSNLKRECGAFTFKEHCAHFGVVLCGDKLVDDASRKQAIMDLLNVQPDGRIAADHEPVVAGEMEGSGMMRALQQFQNAPPAFLIKGLSDWGTDKKVKGQAVAALNAGAESKVMRKIEQVKATYVAFAFIASMLKNFVTLDLLPTHVEPVREPTLQDIINVRKQKTEIVDEGHELYESCQQVLSSHTNLLLNKKQQKLFCQKIAKDKEVCAARHQYEIKKKELSKLAKRLQDAESAACKTLNPGADLSLEFNQKNDILVKSKEELLKAWSENFPLKLQVSVQAGGYALLHRKLEVKSAWTQKAFLQAGMKTSEWQVLKDKLMYVHTDSISIQSKSQLHAMDEEEDVGDVSDDGDADDGEDDVDDIADDGDGSGGGYGDDENSGNVSLSETDDQDVANSSDSEAASRKQSRLPMERDEAKKRIDAVFRPHELQSERSIYNTGKTRKRKAPPSFTADASLQVEQEQVEQVEQEAQQRKKVKSKSQTNAGLPRGDGWQSGCGGIDCWRVVNQFELEVTFKNTPTDVYWRRVSEIFLNEFKESKVQAKLVRSPDLTKRV